MSSPDQSTALGQAMIDVAVTFEGAPWEHQGRSPQGTDCAGFVAEVALRSGAVTNVQFEQDYRLAENGERMIQLLAEYLDPVDDLAEVKVGDILALCDEQLKRPDIPRHLVFVSQLEPYLKGIHASERGVRNHRLDAQWKRRIHSIWRVRGAQSL
jgi:hypothetical protein